jgi:hypothetical protein
MITHTREVLHTTTTNQHNGVFLQAVALTGYVSGHFYLVG